MPNTWCEIGIVKITSFAFASNKPRFIDFSSIGNFSSDVPPPSPTPATFVQTPLPLICIQDFNLVLWLHLLAAARGESERARVTDVRGENTQEVAPPGLSIQYRRLFASTPVRSSAERERAGGSAKRTWRQKPFQGLSFHGFAGVHTRVQKQRMVEKICVGIVWHVVSTASSAETTCMRPTPSPTVYHRFVYKERDKEIKSKTVNEAKLYKQ